MRALTVESGGIVDAVKLRSLAWSGIPYEVRPIVWQLLLVRGRASIHLLTPRTTCPFPCNPDLQLFNGSAKNMRRSWTSTLAVAQRRLTSR